MTENTPHQRLVKRLASLMVTLQTTIDPTVPVQVVRTFLVVALNEGKSLTEIAAIMGANLSTASRHALDLGERNRKMEPGYGLVQGVTDPMSLRTKNYSLTPKGRMVLQSLIEIIEG